jgi:hypothetical protein
LYSQALVLYREVVDINGTAMVLNNLGKLYWRTGKYKMGLSLVKEALITWEELNSPYITYGRKIVADMTRIIAETESL